VNRIAKLRHFAKMQSRRDERNESKTIVAPVPDLGISGFPEAWSWSRKVGRERMDSFSLPTVGTFAAERSIP